MTLPYGWFSASSGLKRSRGDELLHDRVVGRDLLDRTVAQEVDARVADVERDPLRRLVADVEVHAGEGRSGAVVGGLGMRRDVFDRTRERLLDRLRRHGAAGDDAAQPVDRARAGDLAADVAAHAVRDDEQRIARQQRVLIDLAAAAGVRRARPGQFDRPARHRHRLGVGGYFGHALSSPLADNSGDTTRCGPVDVLTS